MWWCPVTTLSPGCQWDTHANARLSEQDSSHQRLTEYQEFAVMATCTVLAPRQRWQQVVAVTPVPAARARTLGQYACGSIGLCSDELFGKGKRRLSGTHELLGGRACDDN